MCGFALKRQGWHLLNEICWYKPNAEPNLSCRVFTASHETLIWASKSKKAKYTFNYKHMKQSEWKDVIKKPGKQMRSVWAISPPSKNEKRYGKHPAQKPEALLERIILACSDVSDLVLDPFAGSATTGVATTNLNRRFIGFEAARDYLEIGDRRLRDCTIALC